MAKCCKALVGLVLCVGMLALFVPQAEASSIGDYWRINETYEPDYDPPWGMGWFEIINEHESESIVGFAVALGGDPEYLEQGIPAEVHCPYPAWQSNLIQVKWEDGTVDTAKWDSWTGWYGLGDPDASLADWYGASWEEAFPDDPVNGPYWYAAVYWSNQDTGAPGEIPAHTSVGLDPDGDPYFYYNTASEPYSPARIRLKDGGQFGGPTGEDNPFGGPPGPVIPEPATLTLLGLGIVGLAFRRRRK